MSQTSRLKSIPIEVYDAYGLMLGLHPANERRRYKVTPSISMAERKPRSSPVRAAVFESILIGEMVLSSDPFSSISWSRYHGFS